MSLRHSGDIVLIGADCNASVGLCNSNDSVCDAGMSSRGIASVGLHGLSHLNKAGQQLRTFMGLHGLVAGSTHFKKPTHGTWVHPRSRRQYQIDHFLMMAEDFKRVQDCGCRKPVIDSDH
jgi:hypothetical protein